MTKALRTIAWSDLAGGQPLLLVSAGEPLQRHVRFVVLLDQLSVNGRSFYSFTRTARRTE
jgi:hypothetical protein